LGRLDARAVTTEDGELNCHQPLTSPIFLLLLHPIDTFRQQPV
jgi:hypothetical protein